MRGKKSGVETLIRETNTTLLDISGETIHIVHTSASHMFHAFDKFLPLQELAGEIYYDAQDSSPKSSYLFGQGQEHLYSKEAKRLIRPISNRFLRTDRLHDLLYAFVVFYFAHLTPEEQKDKSSRLDELFEKHATTVESQVKIKTIIATLGKGRKPQSKESMSRKDKTVLYLFMRKFSLTGRIYEYSFRNRNTGNED
ncbi:hypothetical protein BaRGS_00033975 [Batillaria attramentaria]|uniref:Uncharacterized protein n=1 Tax=Batillaria attramentaria TaxID=370345 RepID=A0ABD0JIX4_9CAEN